MAFTVALPSSTAETGALPSVNAPDTRLEHPAWWHRGVLVDHGVLNGMRQACLRECNAEL